MNRRMCTRRGLLPPQQQQRLRRARGCSRLQQTAWWGGVAATAATAAACSCGGGVVATESTCTHMLQRHASRAAAGHCGVLQPGAPGGSAPRLEQRARSHGWPVRTSAAAGTACPFVLQRAGRQRARSARDGAGSAAAGQEAAAPRLGGGACVQRGTGGGRLCLVHGCSSSQQQPAVLPRRTHARAHPLPCCGAHCR